MTQPFSPALTRQHDLDISCLPYDISPLDLIGRARDMSFGPTEIDENFRFDPRSIKFNLVCFTYESTFLSNRLQVAAYPVLLPVYLLQYAPVGLQSRVTVIVEAHSQPVRPFDDSTIRVA